MEISKENIKRQERDMAGNIRVWVGISPTESRILKFKKPPTLVQVQAEIEKIREPTIEEQIAEIDEQFARLAERKSELLKLKQVD